MIKLKELPSVRINGKTRPIALWGCSMCSLEKEGRSDVKQSTDLCKRCNKITHGKEGKKVYNMWLNIKARCYNPNNNRYSSHGGRGIKVCDEWLESSTAFITWAEANGFKAKEGERNTKFTIDRVDNDGDYEPSNCRIVPLSIQQWNKQKLQKDNTSGFRGVSKKLNRWVGQITHNGEVIFRTSRKSKIQAALAREFFIIDNNLPHLRNWSDKELMEVCGELV